MRSDLKRILSAELTLRQSFPVLAEELATKRDADSAYFRQRPYRDVTPRTNLSQERPLRINSPRRRVW